MPRLRCAPRDGPRNLPLGLADLGCARQTPIVMPRTGPFGSDHGQQSVLVLRRSPTTSCMRSPRSVPVAQLRSQRQRKPTTSLLKAATSPLGTPQSQRTHTSTTSQGTVSEAGSGTPPALVTTAQSVRPPPRLSEPPHPIARRAPDRDRLQRLAFLACGSACCRHHLRQPCHSLQSARPRPPACNEA